MTYWDLQQNGYRCATGQIWITSWIAIMTDKVDSRNLYF